MTHYHCKDCGKPFKEYRINHLLQEIEDVVLNDHDHGMMTYRCKECYWYWLLEKVKIAVKSNIGNKIA